MTARPPGWKGKAGDRYWTKDSAYGVRYRCQTCGRECLGTGSVDRNHLRTCSDPVTIADFARLDESEKRRALAIEADRVRTDYLTATAEERAAVRAALRMVTP